MEIHWKEKEKKMKKQQDLKKYVFSSPFNDSKEIDFLFYSDPAYLPCSCRYAPWWTSSSLQACVALTAEPWREDCPAPSLEGLPYSDDGGKDKLSRQLFSRPSGLKGLEFSSELLRIGL